MKNKITKRFNFGTALGVIGVIVSALVAIALLLLFLWAVCIAGQWVYTTYGVGGLALLCAVIITSMKVSIKND